MVRSSMATLRCARNFVDGSFPFEQLEGDLMAIDPRWVEVLDFAALPSKPLSEAEFS